MDEVCTNGRLLSSIEPIVMFGDYAGGGTLTVDRYQDEEGLCRALGHTAGREGVEYVVVQVEADVVGGAPIDTVIFHRDDSQPAVTAQRAITALQGALEALARP